MYSLATLTKDLSPKEMKNNATNDFKNIPNKAQNYFDNFP